MSNANILDQAVREVTNARLRKNTVDYPRNLGVFLVADLIRTRYREMVESTNPLN